MKQFVLSLLFLSSCVWASDAFVDVKLSPAGSFTGHTSDVKGVVKKAGNRFVAQNIVVNLRSLKTKMSLRDKHTQDYLNTKEHPEAILVKAVGENGRGKGIIRIKGIEKNISGSFKVVGTDLHAEFPLKLSDFKIEGVNYMGVGVKDIINVRVKVPIAN